MSSNKQMSREDRITVNMSCTLNPWGIIANVENMSLSGALVSCLDFPDDLYTTIKGELVISNIKIAGIFVRLDELKVGIEFSVTDPGLKVQIEDFLKSIS